MIDPWEETGEKKAALEWLDKLESAGVSRDVDQPDVDSVKIKGAALRKRLTK